MTYQLREIPTDQPMIGSDIEFGKPDAVGLRTWERALLRGMGSKRSPIVTMNGQYHPDNIFAEMAGVPCATPTQFLANYITLRAELEVHMGMKLVGNDWVEMEIDKEETPRLWRASRAFGCSPDMQYGAYRTVPYEVKQRVMREQGLHIHFQLRPDVVDTIYMDTSTEKHQLRERGTVVQNFVNQVMEGLATYHNFDHPSDEAWFRAPGTYRLKPYGVEYRSLGAGVTEDPDALANLFGLAFVILDRHWGL